ncbi:hypothetical protein [Streptomyces spectabilis]|uniref:Lipoprotein n=1 Tax=Streptomyces spectabilis TaxID=68270 RepID=A0A5P2X5L7_STRST|nr:hypothetical protein [Streptomyces spectabilis]MBB5106442.1 hypothetical protein [Streptomyces spectabilis]MCI3903051.1 hypothetical protein [Streptomyces spectabilis]QEV60303.1 hypothetical protein CP982_17530 [Streptomyces spectabilis]GGV32663.1 lipoprotein [Streptomyces spectabilis]
MNRRPTLLAAASLTAAAVLSLSACGGGDGGSKNDDKIEGAGNGSSESATPSPKASDDAIDRPQIKLPKGVKNVFEGGRTGDAKKDVILADSERRIDSLDEAVTVNAKEHPALKFYSAGDALVSAATYIKGFYDDGRSFVGTTRYYKRNVTILKKGTAAVTYCMDSSKTYPLDRKTKKVDKSIPASDKDYAFFNTRLEKNAEGVWQTTSVTSIEAAKQCL